MKGQSSIFVLFLSVFKTTVVNSFSVKDALTGKPAYKPGQVIYANKNKELEGSEGIVYSPTSNTLRVTNLDAQNFAGSSIDFQGAALLNAALMNATLDNVRHISLESLGVTSLSFNHLAEGSPSVMVVSTARGLIQSVPQVRWEDDELKVSTMSSYGQKNLLKIRANVDFGGHALSNFSFERDTTIKNVVLDHVSILNSVLLHNVTALANSLQLRDAVVDSVTLTSLGGDDQGKFMVVGSLGKLEPTSVIKLDNHELVVETHNGVSVKSGALNLNGNELQKAVMSSGTIRGKDIQVEVQSIKAEEIFLSNPSLQKSLLMVDFHGQISPLNKQAFELTPDGSAIQSGRVLGTLYFGSSNETVGIISNALIKGGSIQEINKLDVKGDSKLFGNVHMQGDVFVDGLVTVHGSVFASGPYVDMSDARIKTDIQPLPKSLDLVLRLQGVTYLLVNKPERHVGFIAQDVEQVLPELVYRNPDGLKGVQYSRVVPFLVECIKELHTELRDLKQVVSQLQKEIDEQTKI